MIVKNISKIPFTVMTGFSFSVSFIMRRRYDFTLLNVLCHLIRLGLSGSVLTGIRTCIRCNLTRSASLFQIISLLGFPILIILDALRSITIGWHIHSILIQSFMIYQVCFCILTIFQVKTRRYKIIKTIEDIHICIPFGCQQICELIRFFMTVNQYRHIFILG
jgi:hypothetical protein